MASESAASHHQPATATAPATQPPSSQPDYEEKPRERKLSEQEDNSAAKETQEVEISAVDGSTKPQEYEEDEHIEPPLELGQVETPPTAVPVDASIEATEETPSLETPPAERTEEKQTEPLPVEETTEAGENAAPSIVESMLEEEEEEEEAKCEEVKEIVKNDKTEEKRLEDIAPTDGTVQQETAKVESENKLIPTKEVLTNNALALALDRDIVSRDVEFTPETNHEDFKEKNAIAEEHKDSETHGQSRDGHHKEAQAKHKHSHSILSKMKQSLVKAKKAIIGKHPKIASPES
ncbi:hypothetical protein Dimus_022785 [Dionaea muscipula]